MASIIDEQSVAEHLKTIVDDLGGRDRAADLIGVDRNSLSNYMNLSGGKKPSNIVAKLIVLGINGNWYLTGEGAMYARDSQPPSEADRHALDVGKEFIALIKKAQEMGTNSGILNSTADCRLPRPGQTEDDDRPFLMPTPPARQQAGPPPSIEAFERSQEGMRSPIRRS